MVFKDEQWLVVEPVPDAFVVNIGHTLQIISNGKLSSAEHRVVTNKKILRMSVVSFIILPETAILNLQKHFLIRTARGSWKLFCGVRKLSLCLLDLITEGLELEYEFFEGELSQVQIMGMNYYQPCPDPTLTLGLLKHYDGNLLTFLLQEQVHDLQVFKLRSNGWLLILSLMPS
ncbi:putative hyoscyamine (6S)-dioxygenase [Rosa chinensis]|uniref:Putative hyoscyamine (6S)-dioxygenase n=1 Tax=Rosa chinensis TaxID=74649 RepID=A0A2P6PVD3_ROSCH|nr:putative hyoscyamine (6S)-dioxygenase [Rosa chinensis]